MDRLAHPPPSSRSLDYSPPSSAKLLGDFCVGSLFSLSEVFHFLEGSRGPGTEPMVPSGGDLGYPFITDPGI
ncbi:hypothetical protein F2Q68_00032621 [Brassica cretica]|uniref:Uncharacterized protein n=1 Tax=Brassica cretica TaxID=69181 RepID=A0A8S9G7R5_BRACR|nr:hypothetical protein F2Q68_00032621 [Brassica cretica]